MLGHRKLNLYFLNFVLILSCQNNDESVLPISRDLIEDFELFWQSMDKNYLYWDIDTVDWDKKYRYYYPIFKDLNIGNFNDRKLAEQYFIEMTENIFDGHFEMTFYQDEIPYRIFNPLLERKRKDLSFNYFSPYISLSYLDENYLIGSDSTSTKFNMPLMAVSGTINNELAYFYCNYFGLVSSYEKDKDGSIYRVIDNFFKLVKTKDADMQGIIIDVRRNPGGDLVDFNFILGQIVHKPYHFGFSQYKSGFKRLDYTNWIEAYILPHSNALEIKYPIVVLADNYSASLSETIGIAVQALPNGLVIGQTTYGATGPILNPDAYIGGSFSVFDFIKVRASSSKFKSLDGQIYENRGVNPDIFVFNSYDSYLQERDEQLEKAIEIIEGKVF